MRKLVIVLGFLMGCEGNKSTAPAPSPQPPQVVRPREQQYVDKVEALRRLIKDGELAASLKAARELFDDHRIDAEGLVVIAAAYQFAGNGEEALRASKAATEKDPKNAAAWIGIGAAKRTLGYFSDAEAALKHALELDPASRAARFNLAGIAADKGELDKAKTEIVTLVEADPDDFETRYLLATIYLSQKSLESARAELAKIIERYPQHFRAQRTLAALAWADEDYKKSFQRAAIALRLRPEDAEAQRLLEGSFYIVAAARLICDSGARPWPTDKVVAVLEKLERDEGLEGVAGFVDLDERYGKDATVQARIAKAAAAAGCKVPSVDQDAGTLTAPTSDATP